MLLVLFVILAAAVVGSFGNNVISYYIKGKGFDIARSRCGCDVRVLDVHENIPLVSYLIQKGRCKICKDNLQPRYLVVEAATVVLALSLYFRYSISVEFIYHFGFLYILLLVCFIDYRKYIIPNLFIVILGVITVFYHIHFSQELLYTNIVAAVIIAIFFVGLNIFYNKVKRIEAIGYGDIKLLIFLTLFYGVVFTVVSLWIASVIVIALVSAKYMVKMDVNMKTKIPLGAYLSVVVIFVNLVYGNTIYLPGLP